MLGCVVVAWFCKIPSHGSEDDYEVLQTHKQWSSLCESLPVFGSHYFLLYRGYVLIPHCIFSCISWMVLNKFSSTIGHLYIFVIGPFSFFFFLDHFLIRGLLFSLLWSPNTFLYILDLKPLLDTHGLQTFCLSL
jgi:hypothetical protein